MAETVRQGDSNGQFSLRNTHAQGSLQENNANISEANATLISIPAQGECLI